MFTAQNRRSPSNGCSWSDAESAFDRFPRTGVATIQVTRLVGIFHRSGQYFSLWRVRGNGVRGGRQFLQETLEQRSSPKPSRRWRRSGGARCRNPNCAGQAAGGGARTAGLEDHLAAAFGEEGKPIAASSVRSSRRGWASEGTMALTAAQQDLWARASTALSRAPPSFVFTSINASRPWLM